MSSYKRIGMFFFLFFLPRVRYKASQLIDLQRVCSAGLDEGEALSCCFASILRATGRTK